MYVKNVYFLDIFVEKKRTNKQPRYNKIMEETEAINLKLRLLRA